jgi:hypothetical protein
MWMIYHVTKAIMKEEDEAQNSWFIRHKELISKAASAKVMLPFIGNFFIWNLINSIRL